MSSIVLGFHKVNKEKHDFCGIDSLWSLVSVALLVALTLGMGFILGSRRAKAETNSASAAVLVADACSLTSTTTSPHTATISPSLYQAEIGSTTLKASCNDSGGFSIYAVGYSDSEFGKTTLTANIGGELIPANDIVTGTSKSGATSNWAMKLATNPSATYPVELKNSYDDYNIVPSTFTLVAARNAGTDSGTGATGAEVTATYAAYVAAGQPAGRYSGKVKYTIVHPANEAAPPQPQPSTAGCITYYANASNAQGTMGCQSATDGNTVRLFASNFSRAGYGFAGWSDAYDYATNPNANFYGPNEDVTVPNGTTANGLALYAVWVKSQGSFQDLAKTASVCNGLTAATTSGTRTLDSVSALTDSRDGQTYAIAKLADNKCWMIENLRLADTHTEGNTAVSTTLTTTNTNKPLNDNDTINPIVTLKHNYSDTQTFTNLSPTSSAAYDKSTAPEGWCTTNSAACDDQSRLRTDNTASRVSYQATDTMSASANLYSYGNYYNWYSATAGNGTYSFSTNNNSVGGDLCPAGWKLPKGGNKIRIESNGDNEFWNLAVVALNNNTLPANYSSSNYPYYTGDPEGKDASKLLRTYPNNLLYSGTVSGASINYRGNYGYYWSSTSSNSYSAYGLRLGSSLVYPGSGSNYKYNGRAVRCLAAQ